MSDVGGPGIMAHFYFSLREMADAEIIEYSANRIVIKVTVYRYHSDPYYHYFEFTQHWGSGREIYPDEDEE